MAQKVAIVTDSSACIPVELVEKYGIGVVPLNVIFGDKTYQDGIVKCQWILTCHNESSHQECNCQIYFFGLIHGNHLGKVNQWYVCCE